MKHLKPFNESKDNLVEELQDFCETNLAYLLDEGMKLSVEKTLVKNGKYDFIGIDITFASLNRGQLDYYSGTSVFWNDIKDHMIPFLTRLKRNYNILPVVDDYDISFRMCDKALKVNEEYLTIDDVINMDEIIQETEDNGNVYFLVDKKIARIWVAVKVKHIKPFNESKDNTEELQDLCDSYFAYLYDEGFEVKIEGMVVSHFEESWGYVIKIVKPTEQRNFSINGNQTFTWDEIKDYFIPFTQQLLKNHDLNPNAFASTGITFKYIKPKFIHHTARINAYKAAYGPFKPNAPWYEHPSTLNAGVFFRPTVQQIINDEILDEPSTVFSTTKCMNHIYEINILVK